MAVQNYAVTILALSWAECSTALVLLFARIYTAWRITRRIRLDLYLIIFAFVIAIIGIILLTMSISHGIGTHQNELSRGDAIGALKWGWINQFVGMMATAFGKLAIVAFLQQIHGPDNRGRVIVLWLIALSNLIVNTITVGLVSTQCSPPGKLWNMEIPGACPGIPRNVPLVYFHGGWSALCDFLLALYPIVFLWSLKLEIRIKIGLCFLMGMGMMYVVHYDPMVISESTIETIYLTTSSACVCCVLKTVLGLVALEFDGDMTCMLIILEDGMSQLIIWNETEKWVVLMVSCIPPIRPLLVAFCHTIASIFESPCGKKEAEGNGDSTELGSLSILKGSRRVSLQRHISPVLFNTKESEESTLVTMEDGAITKTTDINVRYETGPSKGASEYDDYSLPPRRERIIV